MNNFKVILFATFSLCFVLSLVCFVRRMTNKFGTKGYVIAIVVLVMCILALAYLPSYVQDTFDKVNHYFTVLF